MSQELKAVVYHVNRHGILVEYTIVDSTYDTATSKTVKTRTVVSPAFKAYPKQIIADQYKLPNLIGKEVILFYVANNGLSFSPKENDEIKYDNRVYKVHSINSRFASGGIALYRITATRG